MSAATPSALAALQVALATEHSTVYGYSAAGGQLSERRRPEAVSDLNAHSVSRDELASALRNRATTPVAAGAAYAVPKLTTGVAAASFLATLEDATAAAYAGLLSASADPELRRLGVAGLTASAKRATAWRLAAGVTPATKPFPGIAAKPS